MRALRQVSAGQGLMLESSSRRLMQPGMPHHNCPDKASWEYTVHEGLTVSWCEAALVYACAAEKHELCMLAERMLLR